MSVISNANVSASLDPASGKAVAVVTWSTDVAADSKVTYGIGSEVKGEESSPDFVTSHSVTLAGLDPDQTYFALLASTTERGAPCSCDVVSPGSNCTLNFDTPDNAGPATSVGVTATPDRVAIGGVAQLMIAASGSAGVPGGREVFFTIHNGDDRGSFSANPATTDGQGKVTVGFTAKKNGKAQIQVVVDQASKNVDVIVN